MDYAQMPRTTNGIVDYAKFLSNKFIAKIEQEWKEREEKLSKMTAKDRAEFLRCESIRMRLGIH